MKIDVNSIGNLIANKINFNIIYPNIWTRLIKLSIFDTKKRLKYQKTFVRNNGPNLNFFLRNIVVENHRRSPVQTYIE